MFEAFIDPCEVEVDLYLVDEPLWYPFNGVY